VICAELGEINFGYIEGLTFEEISQHYPELAVRLADWSISPEFPGGESFKDFNKRVRKFIPRLESHASEETILIVAHAGSLRLLICNLMKIYVRFWRQMRLELASLSILETHPQGATLMRLNDISHLETQEINRKL
jgi:alpha-ribazole phosphatase